MIPESARRISVGVIAAAGQATRMWPASKVIPKELFPIGRIPALVYVIWEYVEAGVDRIIIVTGKENSHAIQALLDPSVLPPSKQASDPLVRRFQDTLNRASFTFVTQSGPYGNGTPLVNAAPHIGNEACLYAFADDIVLGENASAGLMSVYASTGSPVMAAQSVAASRKSSFGIIECRSNGEILVISRLLEKPRPEETDSTLASLGRYLVTRELLDIALETPIGRDGERWFVDSVIRHVKSGENVCVHKLTTGRWYTVGDPSGFVETVVAANNNNRL